MEIGEIEEFSPTLAPPELGAGGPLSADRMFPECNSIQHPSCLVFHHCGIEQCDNRGI